MEFNFSLDNISEAAAFFLNNIGEDRIVAFYGEMGAGKTTLIAEICRILGADDDFGSPTFSIINEYRDKNNHPIYHFDFYRLESPEEALDIGIYDYFDSGNLCLMEWPERIAGLLPDETLPIHITLNPDGSRKIEFQER